METYQIQPVLEHVVLVIEIVSALILLIGFLKAAVGFFVSEARHASLTGSPNRLSQLRLTLGTYILLGLDFYIVSDIIHSMIRPEWKELLNLLLIVVMRTTIGFFLGKEITEIEKTQNAVTKE